MSFNKIIAFEGRDGVGKTSHIQKLRQCLTHKNIPYIATRELADYEPLLSIKNTLLHNQLNAYEELMLIVTARSWHYRNIIHPALKNGQLVIMDRYIDSTFAYQNTIDPEYIQNMHDLIQCPMPNAVFFIQGTPRRMTNSDQIEQRNEDFFQKVEQRYNSRKQKHWYIYDTKDPFDVIQTKIEQDILNLFA